MKIILWIILCEDETNLMFVWMLTWYAILPEDLHVITIFSNKIDQKQIVNIVRSALYSVK